MALIRISDRNSNNLATMDTQDITTVVTPWFSSQSVDIQANVARLQQAVTLGNTTAVNSLAELLDLDLQYL